METIWFDPGVEHRDTGPRTLWAKKPPRLQIAIILAANRHRGDWWELLKSDAQQRYFRQADKLIAEGAFIKREGTPQLDLKAA